MKCHSYLFRTEKRPLKRLLVLIAFDYFLNGLISWDYVNAERVDTIGLYVFWLSYGK